MKFFKNIFFALAAVTGLQSCVIDNDMSYPRTRAEILSFEVEGQRSVTIDPASRTVSIELDELADITSLKVMSLSITDGASCTTLPEPGDVIDLSSPVRHVLSIYQDYEWTVSASQTIERYVNCTNQVGEAYFNLKECDVTVYVSDKQELTEVYFTDMKLGPEGSEIISTTGYEPGADGGQYVQVERKCTFPMQLNCLLQRTFTVIDRGVETVWTMSVVQRAVSLAVSQVIPWCYHVDVKGTYDGTGTPHFEYRQQGASRWTRFTDVTVDGLAVSATIPGDDTASETASRLAPGTVYEVRICTEDTVGEAVTFTTGTPDQLDNMGFDSWYQSGSTWYPNTGASARIWDTANAGASILGGTNPTMPEYNFLATDDPTNTAAAKLQSMNVAMFAAGNLYTGEFLRISSGSAGMGAALNWGTPFTGRPRALKGYYSYTPATIDKADNAHQGLLGQTDQCQLLVILTDMAEPFTVNTSTGTFFDQTRNNDSIIAYAVYESGESTGGEYREFTLELDWWRPDATPKYAIVIACASYLGNYFTGGVGSIMYVDEFEFIYD